MIRIVTIAVIIIGLSSPGYSAESKPGEVIHWWVSKGESAALQVIIDAFEQRGHRWLDTSVAASYQAKTAAVARMLDGKPPMAVQWHVGKRIEDLRQEGLLRDIQPLPEQQGWQKVLPPVIWDYINADGKVAVAPLTLHGSNWLWANAKVLAEHNVAMPATWTEFIRTAGVLKRAGIIPLALGGQPWQEEFLFHNIALAVGGAEFYEAAFVKNDSQALAGASMATSFEIFAKLRLFVDSESPGRGWTDTAKLLIDGKAAFFVMGDWAKGEFSQAGMDIDKEIACALCPGTANQYVVVADAFAIVAVKDEAVRRMQSDLAAIIMDPEIQRRFNLIKGAIPPRIDAGTEGFDKCARLAMQTVKEGRVFAGLNMANTEIVASAFLDVVSNFWNIPDADPADTARELAKVVAEARF